MWSANNLRSKRFEKTIYIKLLHVIFKFLEPNPSRAIIDFLWIHRSLWSYIYTDGRQTGPPPKIIKNRLNFAHSEKFENRRKNGVFTWFWTKIDPLPVYGGQKKSEKTTKNADEVSGFFGVFWSKSQYMGPQNHQKSWFLPTPPLRL